MVKIQYNYGIELFKIRLESLIYDSAVLIFVVQGFANQWFAYSTFYHIL